MLKAKGLEPFKTLPAIHDCIYGWMLLPRPLSRTKYLDPHSSLFPSSSPPVHPFEVTDAQTGTIVLQQGEDIQSETAGTKDPVFTYNWVVSPSLPAR